MVLLAIIIITLYGRRGAYTAIPPGSAARSDALELMVALTIIHVYQVYPYRD